MCGVSKTMAQISDTMTTISNDSYYRYMELPAFDYKMPTAESLTKFDPEYLRVNNMQLSVDDDDDDYDDDYDELLRVSMVEIGAIARHSNHALNDEKGYCGYILDHINRNYFGPSWHERPVALKSTHIADRVLRTTCSRMYPQIHEI